jgi:glutaredoxin 3
MDQLAGSPGEIKIYTTPWCPFCISAKRLLDKKGATYEDINVANRGDVRAELLAQTGSRTVPQIFIGGQSIGGCDELVTLDRKGELDVLLDGLQAASK